MRNDNLDHFPVVYCDGCGGGGKRLAIGVYSADCGIEIGRQLDNFGTSNEAECLAVIAALEECKTKGITRIRLLSDSLLIVNWANGHWKQRCRTAELYVPRIQQLMSEVGAQIQWIPGKRNLADQYSRKPSASPNDTGTTICRQSDRVCSPK